MASRSASARSEALPRCRHTDRDSQSGRPCWLRDVERSRTLCPGPRKSTKRLRRSGSRTRAESEHEQRSRGQAFRLESSLTNEVQRRAKRVRCNAGLGCWCPLAACGLRSPAVSAAMTPCGVRGLDDRSSADVSEGADVGTTNLGRAPLRVGALVVGAPWLQNRVTARRGWWWLRARLPRRAGESDAADTPTLTPSRGRRSGYAICNARERCARTRGRPRGV